MWIHETGHALAVKLCGHNLHIIRVGRFGFTFNPFKLNHYKEKTSCDIGGYIQHTPQYMQWDRRQDIIISLAGSGACLFTALLALIASVFVIDYPTFFAMFSYYNLSEMINSVFPILIGPYSAILLSCVILGIRDCITNWVPRQLSTGPNDGAKVLELLKEPDWNDQSWAERLLSLELAGTIKISDDDLSIIRKFYKKSPWTQTGKLKTSLAAVAWRRTEPHNFIEIINHNNTDFKEHPPELFHQYMASLVLCNQADEHLLKDFQNTDVQKEDATLVYWFASSLVHYKQKHYDACLASIEKCREAILKHFGRIGSDEEEIFDMMISRKPLPIYV